MANDVDTLQAVILRMQDAGPFDVLSCRNGRGQSLLDIARERRKQACVDFLQAAAGHETAELEQAEK